MPDIYVIANWFTGLIEAYVSYILFETFLKRRDHISKYLYWLSVFVLASLINVSNGLFSSTVLNFSITIVVSLSVSLLYYGTIKIRIVSSVLSFMVSSLAEIIVLLCLAAFFNENVSTIVDNGAFRLLGIAISKMLGYLCARFINYRAKQEYELLNTNYWLFFSIMFASIDIVMGMFYLILASDVNIHIRNMIMVSALGLCVITVIVIYLYENTLKQQIQLANDRMAQIQMKDRNRHYKAMIVSQTKIRGMRHDLKNHLLSIYAKLGRKEYLQCMEYVRALLDATEVKDDFEINTGNTVLDAMLGAKVDEADKKGIDFRINLRIPQDLPIAENDICTIFGNALDNAFEACEKVADAPYVSVSVSYEDDSLVCRIENSCADNTDKVTTKRDIKNHGIGRINIEQALERYGGVFDIRRDRNKYIFSFVLTELHY